MSEHTPGLCACSIRFTEVGGKLDKEYAQIDFCPLHEAASDMLAALIDSLNGLEDDMECRNAVLAAIAKAEGR